VKWVVVGLIIGLVLGVFVGVIFISPYMKSQNKPFPIRYAGEFSSADYDQDSWMLFKFYYYGTLFNCKATLTYLATNGSQVTITKLIGIVDVNALNSKISIRIPNYSLGNVSYYTYTRPLLFNETNGYEITGVKIDAVGFLKP
jgi:hypothetical protein